MNRTWTVYRAATGELLRHFSGPLGSEQAQIVLGERLHEGELDLRRQCIDTETGLPMEYRPPQTEQGARWSESEWRWITRAERNRPHVAEILELEAQQPRAVRELLLELAKAAKVDAGKLKDIDDQIEALRGRLEA